MSRGFKWKEWFSISLFSANILMMYFYFYFGSTVSIFIILLSVVFVFLLKNTFGIFDFCIFFAVLYVFFTWFQGVIWGIEASTQYFLSYARAIVVVWLGYYLMGFIIKYSKSISADLVVSFLFLLTLFLLFLYLVSFGAYNALVPRPSGREYLGFSSLYQNPNYWIMMFYSLLSIKLYIRCRRENFFWYVLLIIVILVSVFSLSRMALLLLLVFLLVYSAKKFFFAIVFVLISFSLWFEFEDVKSVFSKVYDRFYALISGDDERLIRAISIFDNYDYDRFVFGNGLGLRLNSFDPHNTFISVFIDFGLLGILFLFIVLLLMLFGIFKKSNYNYVKESSFVFMSILIMLITNDVVDSIPFFFMVGIYVYFNFDIKERPCYEKQSFDSR